MNIQINKLINLIPYCIIITFFPHAHTMNLPILQKTPSLQLSYLDTELKKILNIQCSPEKNPDLWEPLKADAARLINDGANPDTCDNNGYTLFDKAVDFDDIAYVNFLGNQLRTQEKIGASGLFNIQPLLERASEPLSPFFCLKSIAMMQALLDAGGNINIVGRGITLPPGYSVLHKTCIPDVSVDMMALTCASMSPDAIASRTEDGNTPLHELALLVPFYAEKDCVQLCKKALILTRYILVESKNNNNKMAHELIEEHAHEPIHAHLLRLLLKNEYDKKMLLQAKYFWNLWR